LRRVVIAREISKVFETVHECALGELSGWLQADVNRQRGEFVVMVDAPERQTDTDEVESRRLLGILLAELPLKQAVGLAARIGGGSRNRLYQLALTLKNSGASDNC
jgi:16S rRNA (cytidine1402-2'-O)-methyltransferase